jgi:cobalt-precorrin 5A hydrolase/precorrin-3B C17-methyltransferase
VKRPAIINGVGSRRMDRANEIAAIVGGDVYGPFIDRIPVMQALFREGRPIIGMMSCAIIIRALAGLLHDKRSEPPVLCVTGDGRYAIPLLGQHHGANRLAEAIAKVTGASVVFSAATDLFLNVALDDSPDGYTLENAEDYKAFATELLNGSRVRVSGRAEWLSPLPQADDGELSIIVSEREIAGSSRCLVFHPHTLTIGVGCERGASHEELRTLASETMKRHELSWRSVANIASIDLKEDEEAIHGMMEDVRFFTADELNAQSQQIKTPSAIVEKEVGTPSVAEAAALAAAGPGSELIVAKIKSKRCTIAIARAPEPISEPRGRPRGILFVVGLGPGEPVLRSARAHSILADASDWVGYSLYLDLARDVHHQQAVHAFALGEEEARARHAIFLAKEGKRVALVCSGDAGIYAMASLVYEIIDKEPCRIAVEVIPGISAFQAAAAKAGAMIGHDFCCISLSDLLTPWETIEKRVQAAAMGDFVVAFYNPRSAKRRDQLERAMAVLKAERPADTPVVIASNLGRQDERVRIVPFAAFNPDDVDMLTIVLVGSSQSKAFKRGDGRAYAYTPRGYAQKRGAP